MKISVRSSRSALGAVGVAGAATLVAVLMAQSAPAAADRAGPAAPAATAAHRCLVATGSGDPAFVRNFNPYVQGLPSSSFVRGGMYEPLVIATPAGGGRLYKWLPQSYAWSKDAKTLTLNIRQGVKWTDGKPLTAADVVYSLTAGKQDPAMDILGVYRAGHERASVRQTGSYKSSIRLKTRDSQFVAVNLNGIFVVPKHVFSKVADINKFLNPNPVGSGPVRQGVAVHLAGLRPQEEPELLAKGLAEDRVPRVHPGHLERRRAAADPQRPGRLDAQLRAERREGLHREGSQPLPRLLRDDGVPDLADVRHAEVPVQHVAFRKAISRAIDRNKVSKLGEYGYAPPTDAIGLSGLFPSWLNPAVAAKAKTLANFNPARRSRC